MKFRQAVRQSIALAVLCGLALPVAALMVPSAHAYSEQERYFNRDQIEQLTAPIALYPDPLLAHILTAAAYPEEIASAHRYVQGRSDWNDIERQDWDYSVRAIARYPEILDFLARDLEWTEALGIANINQPDDIADAIQRWRLQAYNLGNLRSSSQQIVYLEDGYVRIVPAEQDYFYVPRYDPEIIYVTRYIGTPFLVFGPAYAYGAWFDRDWDWRRRRICYVDRRHWRNGRPVFYPRLDEVHPDHDWKPDRRRFKPPETPRLPPRFVSGKVPSPPASVQPGRRFDGAPRPDGGDQPKSGAIKPTDRPERGKDQEKPAVLRGTDRDYKREDRPDFGKQGPAPTPGVEQPRRIETQKPADHGGPSKVEPRRIEQPTRTDSNRRIEQQPKVEPQKRVEQPVQQQQQQQQQQRQTPQRRQDDDQEYQRPRR